MQRPRSPAFEATLFRYPGAGGWTFARIPERHAVPATHPWGRTPVFATVDGARWATSVWRDKTHGTLLPVPARLRGRKGDGDTVTVRLEPRDAPRDASPPPTPGASSPVSYDELLAARIRKTLAPTTRVSEKKMFGGLAFLADGKMFVGINATDLMVRVGPDAYESSLAKKHVRPMDFTGRPLTGYVYVAAAGTKTTAAVSAWVRCALAFVSTLPAKPTKPRRRT